MVIEIATQSYYQVTYSTERLPHPGLGAVSATVFLCLRAYLNGKLFANIFAYFSFNFTKKIALTAQLA